MTITSRVQEQLFESNERRPIRIAPSLVPSQALAGAADDFPAIRSRGAPWTADEHERFLDALAQFPFGPWKRIAQHVGTRTARQAMSHAQKYRQKIRRRQRYVARQAAAAADDGGGGDGAVRCVSARRRADQPLPPAAVDAGSADEPLQQPAAAAAAADAPSLLLLPPPPTSLCAHGCTLADLPSLQTCADASELPFGTVHPLAAAGSWSGDCSSSELAPLASLLEQPQTELAAVSPESLRDAVERFFCVSSLAAADDDPPWS